MKLILSTVVLFFSLVTSAIGQTPPSPPEPPGSHDSSHYNPKGNEPFDELAVLKGLLELEMSKDNNEIRGAFVSEKERVAFESLVQKETQQVIVNVEIVQVVLLANIDFSKEAANLTGKSNRTSPEGITPRERTLILSALRAIEERRRSKEVSLTLAWEALEKSLALWSEWPGNLSLSQSISSRKNDSLCKYAECITTTGPSYFGSCVDSNGNSTTKYYEFAQHDCDRGDFNTHDNQQRASLGAHSSCPGEEWYWDGSKWECGEPDHWTRPYVQGNCFGRCGPGCGMIGTYTEDCTNHDGCVRNGHSLASPFCNDQFVACIDDTLFSDKCYTREL